MPRIISIIGRKNAGKTSLVVALARELRRGGHRLSTIKHASHPALTDREGTDSWRHYNEGNAEQVMVASPTLRVLFERRPDDTDPETLARRYMAETELVLVEGFKSAPIPKIEVHRRIAGPLFYDPNAANAELWIAIVTDDQILTVPPACRLLRFTDTMWLQVLGRLVLDRSKPLAP